jgi:putative glutamine transport system substrate-binding protein
MTLRRRVFLTVALCALALTGTATMVPTRAADDTTLDAIKKRGILHVGVRGDAPGFGTIDMVSNQPVGFEVDLAHAIAKRILGSPDKVEFTIVKSDNRIPLVQNGSIDFFLATATITPLRMKTIAFSNVYYRAGQSLLVKSGSPIHSYHDLAGKSVCTVQGSTPEQTIRRIEPKANVVTFETYPECLTGLRGGRVDAVTTDNTILQGYEGQDPANLAIVGGLFTFEPYGAGIKLGNTSLQKAIDAALEDIKKSGDYDKIHQKWLHGIVPPAVNSAFGMSPEDAAAKWQDQKPG